MQVRKFYLADAATGERWPLDGSRGVWCTAPEGLGFELDADWSDLGSGFFAQLGETRMPQGTLPATLIFDWPAYRNYRALVDWVSGVEELLLIYSPYGEAEFQRRVVFQALQKGELTKTRLLECPASLLAVTPWYLPVPTEVAMATEDPGKPRKRYSYRYTAQLRYGGAAAGGMSARIKAAGHIPGAILLRYRGGIINPRIRLTGAVSGKVYGICALTATLGSSDELELSTLYEDSHVLKRAADGTETDLLADVDLGHDPYVRAPIHEDSILTIESAAPFTGTASLLVYGYYRSV